MVSPVFNSFSIGGKISWKKKKSAVPEKKEEVWKTAGNLMIQIIMGLNAEGVRREEPAREEKQKDTKKAKLKNGLNIR